MKLTSISTLVATNFSVLASMHNRNASTIKKYVFGKNRLRTKKPSFIYVQELRGTFFN